MLILLFNQGVPGAPPPPLITGTGEHFLLVWIYSPSAVVAEVVV